MSQPPRSATLTVLAAGFVVAMVFTIGFGYYVTGIIGQLVATTEDLYTHPFTVSNAAQQLKGSLFQMRNQMIQLVVIDEDKNDAQELLRALETYKASVDADLKVIRTNFLGDMTKVQELERKFEEWNAIRAEILELRAKGKGQQAIDLVKSGGTPKFNELIPLVEYIKNFALDRAQGFADEAHAYSKTKTAEVQALFFLTVLGILVTAGFVYHHISTLQTALMNQATIDSLTGVPNRQHFLNMAERELALARRNGTPLSIAMGDLDLFKVVNDTHGHAVGDRVLQHFSEVCKHSLRAADVIGRVGGEEFALLLPNADPGVALAVIERLRKNVEASELALPGKKALRVTASFGVVDCLNADQTDLLALLKQADQAMYQAKEQGRNRVVAHEAA